jgi:hypothetical protein
MQTAVVVCAYNRPQALARLLASLKKAYYPPGANIPLHISIDRSEAGISPEVLEVANQFNWLNGKKIVAPQSHHLGLVEHINYCGGLSQEYGAIILLEDDLFVSNSYYAFTNQALEFYCDDKRVAGISLYNLWFNGYTHNPFLPVQDEADIFFLQIPYTQGQAFTADQWAQFAFWQANSNVMVSLQDKIHEMFLHFNADDWFPTRTKYLIETDRFFVFPRVSLATGFGDAGTHFTRSSSFFQVPLQAEKKFFSLISLEDSNAVYDSFFEILPDRLDRLVPTFQNYAYEVDLNGTKSKRVLEMSQDANFVLTTRSSRSPIYSYAKAMRPLEANIIEEIPGDEIVFCRKNDLNWGWLADTALQKSNLAYYERSPKSSRRQRLKFLLLELLSRLRLWDR